MVWGIPSDGAFWISKKKRDGEIAKRSPVMAVTLMTTVLADRRERYARDLC